MNLQSLASLKQQWYKSRRICVFSSFVHKLDHNSSEHSVKKKAVDYFKSHGLSLVHISKLLNENAEKFQIERNTIFGPHLSNSLFSDFFEDHNNQFFNETLQYLNDLDRRYNGKIMMRGGFIGNAQGNEYDDTFYDEDFIRFFPGIQQILSVAQNRGKLFGEKKAARHQQLFLQLRACFFYFKLKIPTKAIGERLSLSRKQVSNAIYRFKKRRFSEEKLKKYYEREYKNKIIGTDLSRWIESFYKRNQESKSYTEVLEAYRQEFPSKQISYASIRRAVISSKLDLSRPKPQSARISKKANPDLVYQYFFSATLLSKLKHDKCVVSINECFILTSSKTNFSALEDENRQINYEEPVNTSNLTLLIAVAQFGVIGYHILGGPATSIVFIDFIDKVVERLSKGFNRLRPLIVMNNAHVHKSKITEKYFLQKDITVLYMAKYCRELNFADSLLAALRRKLRKIPKGSL